MSYYDGLVPRNAYLFRSARFGSSDVTLKVAILARDNAGTLSLSPPIRIIQDGRGRRVNHSGTTRYWYLRYFGDPNPFTTKMLEITFLDSRTDREIVVEFPEQTTLNTFIGV